MDQLINNIRNYETSSDRCNNYEPMLQIHSSYETSDVTVISILSYIKQFTECQSFIGAQGFNARSFQFQVSQSI